MRKAVRKVDVYLNLKAYGVSETLLNGARAMANWYACEGNGKMQSAIEMLLLRVDDNVAIGEVFGRLQAYSKKFAELATACEVCEEIA